MADAEAPPGAPNSARLTFNVFSLQTGVYVFHFNATDPDGDRLTYGVIGQDSYYFNCNASTGIVTLAISVDYEFSPQLTQSDFHIYHLPIKSTVKISKNSLKSDKIKCFLKEETCSGPITEAMNVISVTEFVCTEKTTLGTTIFKVTAKDYDDDGEAPVTFEITEIIPDIPGPYLFYIERQSDKSPTIGNIVLNDSLDYNKLSTLYQIDILAKDRGGIFNGAYIQQNSSVFVSVKIVDEPDLDPEFIGAPYVMSIYENATIGNLVGRVSAIDPDRGINDKILYSISSSTVSGLFDIDELNGEIRVIGDLDREELLDNDEQVILTVLAREENLNIHFQIATATTSFTIRVLDVNDNKPQFYNCEVTDCNFKTNSEENFYGEIEEHSSVRVPVANLTITVNDPDKDQNGAFNLYLRGKDADYFTVSPTRVINTGLVQVLVKDPKNIDYEKVHKMFVEIVANDTGNSLDCCSVAFVTIQLININDHIPEFNSSLYELQIEEHCPNGTSLGKIQATDLDAGDYGIITYGLLPPSILTSFNVNSSTGEIIVVNGDLLDRERLSQYYATLQARDGGNATGTTLLEITLIDINDWPPEAIGTYNIFVNENTEEVYIEIKAIDNDEPGNNNSIIRFQLLPGYLSENFTINSITGVITTLTPLDREEIDITLNGRIVLTVELYDLGVPSLSSEVNVTINVEDLNDNAPIFTQSEYIFSVNESTEGVCVGNVKATDADQTELNNRISFRISQGGSGNFIIRGQQEDGISGQYLGQLCLDPEVKLDYEQQKIYILSVEAQDYGFQGVTHTADATVIVNVLDLNDEPPYINPSTLVNLYVVENRTGDPEQIALLNATDPDTDHLLEFQSLSVSCYKNSKDVGNICYDWLWLAPDGRLFVNYTEDVDYELCDQIDMLLRVEDKLTLLGDRYSNNVTQRVIILDANDNAPKFLDITQAFVVIPETSVIGTEVASVKAEDKDSGPNAELIFSIDKVEFIFSSGGVQQLANLFTVTAINENNIYTGSIKVAINLDRTLQGQYNVTVRVTDKGDTPLNAIRFITIFTIDESYRAILRFSKSVDEVTENAVSIMGLLSKATGASVFVSGIEPDEGTNRMYSRASERSILSVYCLYANGTAITPDQLSRIIQSDEEVLRNLLALGLTLIGNAQAPLQTEDKILYGIVAGLGAVVILLTIIMTISLVCMRKSHKRKLRAVKASKLAKSLPGEAVQGVEVIPGTNKFNSDGANPMLNIDMGTFLDLGFEETSSVTDSISVHSDYNNVFVGVKGDTSMDQDIQECNFLMRELWVEYYTIKNGIEKLDKIVQLFSGTIPDHEHVINVAHPCSGMVPEGLTGEDVLLLKKTQKKLQAALQAERESRALRSCDCTAQLQKGANLLSSRFETNSVAPRLSEKESAGVILVVILPLNAALLLFHPDFAPFSFKNGKDGEEPLAAALNERKTQSYDNTALDTTDL
ncbi:cadherin-related family member 2 [Mantella aurantiaca]